MNPFWTCQKGNIAVFFSLTILPVLGAAGVAVDYARAYNTKSFLQSQADRAALFAIQGGSEGNTTAYIDNFKDAMRARYGDVDWINNTNVEGKWTSDNDFRVDARAEVPVTLLAAVPGMRDFVPVSVSSSVVLVEPRWVYSAPTVSQLDHEAGDYNRISVYCFDPEIAEETGSREEARSTPIPIADNGGSTFEFEMPRCAPGQVMSFKLLNVRLVRGQPHNWHDPNEDRFEYYTDTTLDDDGVEQYDINCAGTDYCNSLMTDEWKILETVLCDTKEDCKPESQGGIIPEGKDRDNPKRADKACEDNKYMYYGWEDRPPNLDELAGNWEQIGWTDKDYDDIRIVIGCPRLEKEGERAVRLTQ